jgi:hypothetical protein
MLEHFSGSVVVNVAPVSESSASNKPNQWVLMTEIYRKHDHLLLPSSCDKLLGPVEKTRYGGKSIELWKDVDVGEERGNW